MKYSVMSLEGMTCTPREGWRVMTESAVKARLEEWKTKPPGPPREKGYPTQNYKFLIYEDPDPERNELGEVSP